MSLQQALTAAADADAAVATATESELLTAYKAVLDDPAFNTQLAHLRRLGFALKAGESRGVFDVTNQMTSTFDHANQVITNRLVQLDMTVS